MSNIEVNTIERLESKLIPVVLKNINSQLRNVKSGFGLAANEDMNARKRQAVIELTAIKNIDPKLSRLEQAIARRDIAQTALKLDPTSLDAAFELIRAQTRFYSSAAQNDPTREIVIIESMELFSGRLDQLLARSDEFDSVRDVASYLFHVPGLIKNKPNQKRRYYRQFLHIVELDLARSFEQTGDGSERMLLTVVQGLVKCGVPPDELEPHLSKIIGHLERFQIEHDQSIVELKKSESLRDQQMIQKEKDKLRRFRQSAIDLCSELKLIESYDRLWPAVKQDLLEQSLIGRSVELRRREVKKLGDEKRLADFESWIAENKIGVDRRKSASSKKNSKAKSLLLMELKWPQVDVLAGTKAETAQTTSVPIDLPSGFTICPLGKTKTRLYFVTSDAKLLGWRTLKARIQESRSISNRQKFGYLPLGSDGLPSGPAEYLELPDHAQGHSIQGLVANNESLVIGTMGFYGGKKTGLYFLDIKKNKWKYYGVEEGLPAQWVVSLQPLGDNLAVCVGNASPERRVSDSKYQIPRETCFTFDLRTQEIRYYPTGKSSPRQLFSVYEDKGRVNAFGNVQWSNLLSRNPVRVKPKSTSGKQRDESFYWHANDACYLKNKVYFINGRGLHQMNFSSEVTRSWLTGSKTLSPLNNRRFLPETAAPSQAPLLFHSYLVSTDNFVLNFQFNGDKVVAYDPAQDRWHGPVRIPQTTYALADGDHVWIGGKTLFRLSEASIVSTAKASNRVFTSAEIKAKQESMIEGMSGLQRAKIEFSLERFEPAKMHAQQLIERNPADSMAHLMDGIIHDSWGLNQPEIASKAYEESAKTSDDRGAALSALYLELEMLSRAGNGDAASELSQRILRDYPEMASHIKKRVIKYGSAN